MTQLGTTKSGIIKQGFKNLNNILNPVNLSVGMILDSKYEIKREISRGGMGIVYEAYDQYIHRQVAIKIILGNKIDTLQLKRFEKEIEACARLSHPNVIKIYDAGTYENNPYIVMEYIDGVNISQYIMQHDESFEKKESEKPTIKKERDWKLCTKLIYETALGLEYIHKQKMFHRDIKPTNIIVRSNGSPVIIDLGLVKFNQERSYNLTRSRDIIGTCQYMPIEQVQGKRGKVDARSDVYSLGLVLYELLTEQRAYTGRNISDVFNKIVSYYPPLPREINPQIPEVLEEITIHATEKQKDKRYETAQAFADALKQYLDDTTTKATNQYEYYKKRLWIQKNKRKIVVSCIIILLAMIATFTMISQNIASTPQDQTVEQKHRDIQNEIETQFQLAKMYYKGEGVKQDYTKAFYWWEKVANQGYAEAQCNLGVMYENGYGVKQDYTKAFYWYAKAANQGNAQAQCNLGVMYKNGYGVKQDYQKSFFWIERSAIQGNLEAQGKLGNIYYSGYGVEKDYKKAFYWWEKTANQGHSMAQYNLGLMYQKGEGVTQDIKKAFYWFEQAANQKYADAQYNLGVMYQSGYGVEKDYKKAFYWWEQAANQKYIMAQYNLALMYYEGYGVEKDYKKAFYWWEQAAIQKYANAQYNLGFMYENGKGVKKDYKKAIEWYKKATEQGFKPAQQKLNGLMQKK